MTCKELSDILLKTPDKSVVIAKAEVVGDLYNVWIKYLDKQYIKPVILKDGTEAIVLDDNPWV